MGDARDSLSAATRIVGVMGDPVAHSMSPLIHNTGFRDRGLDWVCVGFPTSKGMAIEAVRGIPALGVRGMSVTMPHKNAVIPALDSLSDDAGLLDAVNCIQVDGGRLVGHNTDGAGFVAALNHDFGLLPQGLDCVVIGAGGAARSVVLALGRGGASSVTIVNRSAPAARVAAELVDVARVGTFADVPDCDLVVNATPLGMVEVGNGTGPQNTPSSPSTTDEMPCDPALLSPGQTVVDLIYQPLRTQWLAAAAARGARTANGTSMLVHQAAIAFELWTGVSAPVSAMSDAVAREVDARSR